MLSNNRLDFDDLMALLVLLLRSSAEMRDKMANRWSYLLVDEFQDTDHLQYEIVEYCLKAGVKTTVVGDENQSIYGFRGAVIDNILDFPKKIKDVGVIPLEENYRNTQPILDLANEIIVKNELHFKKKNVHSSTDGRKACF